MLLKLQFPQNYDLAVNKDLSIKVNPVNGIT